MSESDSELDDDGLDLEALLEEEGIIKDAEYRINSDGSTRKYLTYIIDAGRICNEEEEINFVDEDLMSYDSDVSQNYMKEESVLKKELSNSLKILLRNVYETYKDYSKQKSQIHGVSFTVKGDYTSLYADAVDDMIFKLEGINRWDSIVRFCKRDKRNIAFKETQFNLSTLYEIRENLAFNDIYSSRDNVRYEHDCQKMEKYRLEQEQLQQENREF